MRSSLVIFAAFSSIVLSGCGASTPGAKPGDMSAAGHEAAASEHDKEGAGHAAQYDPSASAEKEQCAPGGPKNPAGGPCWTSIVNPTAAHNADAEKHKKMAADHRAASQALRDAENRACAGIGPADRDTSPFMHPEDIASVAPLSAAATPSGKPGVQNVVGATVKFRAVPGLTAEWLQHTVDCHIARSASLGNDVPEMPSCPLVPKGAKATVTSAGDGFLVAIRSDDVEIGKEILRRAQQLAPK